MSGLSHTPGKRARGKTLRGFESRLLRQIPHLWGIFLSHSPHKSWLIPQKFDFLRLT